MRRGRRILSPRLLRLRIIVALARLRFVLCRRSAHVRRSGSAIGKVALDAAQLRKQKARDGYRGQYYGQWTLRSTHTEVILAAGFDFEKQSQNGCLYFSSSIS